MTNSIAPRGDTRTPSVRLEPLESRRLLSTVVINGTPANDLLHVQLDGDHYVFTVNDASFSVARASVSDIIINTFAGHDQVKIEAVEHPTTLIGGDGNDTFEFASAAKQISAIAAIVSIDGGNGADTASFFDTANMHGNCHVLDASQYSTEGASPSTITYSSVSELKLFSGEGYDTILVNGTPANSVVRIQPNRHYDVINVNETAPGASVVIDPTNNTGYPDDLNVNMDGIGTAVVRLETTVTLDALEIGSGGQVKVLSEGEIKFLGIMGLTISGNGFLDLGDNAMIYSYFTDSPLESVRAYLTSGRNGGTWNGAGINCSFAASHTGMSLGYAEASDLSPTFPVPFAGLELASPGVLVRCTQLGDANLDGAVNLADFNRLASNFGQSARRWSQGDFDYDADVDLADFDALASNFGSTKPLQKSVAHLPGPAHRLLKDAWKPIRRDLRHS